MVVMAAPVLVGQRLVQVVLVEPPALLWVVATTARPA
jgi:hypothetical protein